MKKLILLLLLNRFFITGFSQNNYEHLSVQQELAENSINCIIQDQTGFIWIGGDNGLYKYDGYNFTPVKTAKNCTNCPSYKKVFCIRVDNYGLLWLLTDDGIMLFNPKNEKLKLIYEISWDEDHLKSKLSNGLAIDSHNNIWSINQTGVVEISYERNFVTQEISDSVFINPPENIFNIQQIQLASEKYSPENKALSLYKDDEQNIWAGCLKGVYLKAANNETFVRADGNKGLSTVTDILQRDAHSFWLISDNMLYLLSDTKSVVQSISRDFSLFNYPVPNQEKNHKSLCLLRDHQNNFLLGTMSDLYKLRKDDKSGGIIYESVHNEEGDVQNEDLKQIHYIFEDRSGVLWASMLNNGISKFNLAKSRFTSYNSLITKTLNVNSILKDLKGDLWIGSYSGGLLKISLKNKNTRNYDSGFATNRIISLKESSPGIFLIGLYPGILEFNSETGKFSDPLPDTKAAENLRGAGVIDLLKDGELFYIGTAQGLFIFNVESKKLFQFTFTRNDSGIDLSNTISSIIKTRSGEILVSSCYHGINRVDFNPQNGSVSLSPIIPDKLLTDNGVIDIERHRLFEDSNGTLWITNYSGLHSINVKTREIKTYPLFENIKFPQVWSIAEDDYKNLWMGTHKGLCRFNIKTGSVRVFDSNDGLPVTIHGFNSVFKDKDGRMFFGGTGGLYSFQPDSLETNDSVPPVVITDFRIANKIIKPDSAGKNILSSVISYTSMVKLNHNQNNLTFQFASLDYNNPSKNKYQYKLEGYQKEWVESNANIRNASYSNLSPGTYIFRVKGSNNEGVWNEKGASLRIIIHKPWWGTIFAWCLYITLLIGSAAGLIYRRQKKLRMEKLVLENQVIDRTRKIEEQKAEILAQRNKLEEQNRKITELDEIKSRFFTNISHEFRTPLSLIQSPVEELLDDPRHNEKDRRKLNLVHRNSQRLLNLVNQLLDISKIDGSKMKLELVEADVMKHLRSVAGSFSSLAETKSILYHLDFPDEELKTLFDPDKLEKIAINLLSNAFKFTPEGGEITFTATYKNNFAMGIPQILEFSVIDNGTGIPAESQEKIFDRFYQVESSLKKEGGGTGIGLSLSREMARLMHGDVTIKSEHCAGSTFIFQCPLGIDHLEESEFTILKDLSGSFTQMAELGITDEDPIQNVKSSDKDPVLLIVEDNRDIRMYLNDNFSSNYNTHEAIDGVSGLKKATELIPDLIITDLMMPHMDGMELCRKLKNDVRTSHIPIIMLTAKTTTEDKISGLQTGADDYIPKPFSMVELKTRANNLITQRKKLREQFSREITLEPMDISITPIDEKFLKRAIELVEKHINEEKFDLTVFRKEMNMSRSTLFRKLQALTGQSPTEFIRSIRLKRAASLLKQNFGNVTQVSLEVGFNNLSYFNRTFKKLFGVSPLEYSKSDDHLIIRE